MTDQDPSARDELIAAYLDGEATPAQRAIVERDPALMERAELLQQVAISIGEPVMAPPAHVRRAHIAAALDASDTAPKVSSLASRRSGIDFTTLASIAAVVLLILAVPVVLLRNGTGGDDDASTAASEEAIATLETARDSSDGTTTTEGAPAGENTDEPFTATAPAAAGPADEPAEAPAEEPAEEEAAEEEAPAEEALDSDQSGELSRQTRFFNFELVPNVQRLSDEVLALIADDSPGGSDTTIDQFECVVDWLDEDPTGDLTSVLLAGDALIGGDFVTYLALQADVGIRLVVFSAESCEADFDGPTFDEIIADP